MFLSKVHKVLRISNRLNVNRCISRRNVHLENEPVSSTPPILKDISEDHGSSDLEKQHHPVMLKEVVSFMDPKPGQTILDMTCGAGGHTEELLKSANDLKVIGLDRDPAAHSILSNLVNKWPDRFFPMLGKFSELPHLLQKRNISKVDGILIDCGCSSMQFDDGSRGFSISKNAPLDMRMDGNRFPDAPTAAQVLEHIEEEDLAKILKIYGEEKASKRIARAIIEARYMLINIKTTHELASMIQSVVGSRLDKLGRQAHGATKTFQALRIFINNEMNELNRAMEIAGEILNPGGRLVALSFHSLEDRIIKRHILGVDLDEPVIKQHRLHMVDSLVTHSKEDIEKLRTKIWSPVNKHVIVPSREEIEGNPRSRSAKLRCAVKN